MDNINRLSNVTRLLKAYEEQSPKRVEKVKKLIVSKKGLWENSLKDENGEIIEITAMLLYEYATSIEEITKNSSRKITFEDVINKLGSRMDRFRLGGWRESDSNLPYGKTLADTRIRVGSEEYRKQTRNFGGATLTYYNQNNNGTDNDKLIQNSVALFDNVYRPEVGKELNDLSILRHVVFHEWTHVMEKVILAELGKDGIPEERYKDKVNNRTFINAEELKNNQGYLFIGVSTKEEVPVSKEYPDGIRMHNQITEGFVELLARKVIEILGQKPETFGIEKYINEGHNLEQTEMAKRIVSARGEADTIADFLTNSAILIGEFEDRRVSYVDEKGRVVGIDGLHYMSEYADNTKRGKTDKMNALRPMGKIAEMMGMSREDINIIQDDSFWNVYNLTPESKGNLRKLVFSFNKNSNITEENFREIFNDIIAKYEVELKKEKSFMDGIPEKMGYKIKESDKDER